MVLLLLAVIALLFYWMMIVTGRYFISSLDNIADYLGMSPNVAGATLMAFGTSAPELFTTVIALLIMPGNGVDIGVGNIIGSAIFQILVVVGIAAVARPAHLRWRPVMRDGFIYALAVCLLMAVLYDGSLNRFETTALLIGYAFYLLVVLNWERFFPQDAWESFDPLEEVEDKFQAKPLQRLPHWQFWQQRAQLQKWWKRLRFVLELPFFWVPNPDKNKKWTIPVFVLSLAGIAGLTYFVIIYAVQVAELMGIPSTIIALTILAGGSSTPEMIASYIVAKQGRAGMAISNAIGSNTFDVLVSMGLPYFVVTWVSGPIHIGGTNVLSSAFLLFMTLLAVISLLAFRHWKVSPRLGSFLIFLYVCYVLAAYSGWL